MLCRIDDYPASHLVELLPWNWKDPRATLVARGTTTIGSKSPMLIRVGRSEELERFQAIDKAARSRYATLPGFEFAMRAPAIDAGRFSAGEVWVAEVDQVVVGFVLLQPHEDTLTSLMSPSSLRPLGAKSVQQ